MFGESEDQPSFEPNWKSVFIRDFCQMCKHRAICPESWECHDMKEFIKNNEEYYADLDNDDTNNGSE